MASVNFRLRSQANKNVSIKVYLSVKRGSMIETSTGFTINPKEWSTEKGMPKQNTEENKKLFNDLKKLDAYIFDKLNVHLAKGTVIDRYWLDGIISTCFNRVEQNDSGLLLNHVQYIIDHAHIRKVKGKSTLGISDSRKAGYKTFKSVIEAYQKAIKRQINFMDINKLFVDKFTTWLLDSKKYSVGYSGKQIDNLKTVCLDAAKHEIPVNAYIHNIEGFKEDDDDRYIVTLSPMELEKIRTAKLEQSYLDNARKWILLGCEIGQRGKDLVNVTKEDFRFIGGDVYLDVVQEKTNKAVTIGIPNPHVIDMIKTDFPHKISIQKLNEYIKTVCKKAGLIEMTEGKKIDPKTKRKVLGFYPKHELVTTHSFRRSFATNYYKKMPTALLISVTGHSKESLFLTYINKRQDKDHNAKMFMDLYRQLPKENEPSLTIVKDGTNE